MNEIITITDQKGGVGKTTTAVNLAAFLAVAERKVFLIDVDPQVNATIGLGLNRNNYEYNTYHVSMGRKKFSDIILKIELPQLHLAPSNIGPVGIEQKLAKDENNEKKMIFKNQIQEVPDEYDFITTSSLPTLGSITINVFVAGDSAIIPIQHEFYALEGVVMALNMIKIIKKTINLKLKVQGFSPTMYSLQNNLSRDVVEDLKQNFKRQLFTINDNEGDPIVIPHNVKLAESPSFGKPIILYDIKSPGPLVYQSLACSTLG